MFMDRRGEMAGIVPYITRKASCTFEFIYHVGFKYYLVFRVEHVGQLKEKIQFSHLHFCSTFGKNIFNLNLIAVEDLPIW